MPGERLDYRIERQRHEGFLGREALLAELDRLLVEDDSDRWVVVMGGPGMGKSAILTAWLVRREAAGAVVPHHFIRRGFYGWDEPATIVRSLAAHIVEQLGSAAVREHHAALAHKLATWPALTDALVRRYALRHALAHRTEAEQWGEVGQLAGDVGFLEAKCRELGIQDVEADVARAAEPCRSNGDQAIGRDLGDLARALTRESHWLREDPGVLAAQLWNRLRRMGWSVDDLGRRLRLPAGATKFARVRHALCRESPALLRDFVGHSKGVNACVVTPDGRHAVSAYHDRTLKVWETETGQSSGLILLPA